MKEKADLTAGWLRKAASDMMAAEAAQNAGAPDAACFHAQQAAEKYLKAFLIDRGMEFPHTQTFPNCSGFVAVRARSLRASSPMQSCSRRTRCKFAMTSISGPRPTTSGVR